MRCDFDEIIGPRKLGRHRLRASVRHVEGTRAT
jgi:hypothetical protein